MRHMSRIGNRLMIMRQKLVRLLLLLARDPLYKSKADYWPWVKVVQTEPSAYAVSFCGRTVCSTQSFSRLRSAERDIAIIGAGPSVNDMRLDIIAEMDCILLNGAVSLIRAHNIKPLAIVIVDSTFIEKRFDALACIPTGSNLILTAGVIRAISERNKSFLQEMNVFLTQNILVPNYNPGPQFQEQQTAAREARFSFDPDCGFVNGGTVMAVAMQLAYYLDVKDTYLIGLDIGNAASPRFYETNKNRLKCGLLKDYETGILPFMKVASRVFAESGKGLYNCSHISKLPYEVISYCGKFRKLADGRYSPDAGEPVLGRIAAQTKQEPKR